MKTLYHDLPTIRASGLLSPARMAEIDAKLAAAVTDVLNTKGQIVSNVKAVEFPDGKNYFYPIRDDWSQRYMEREFVKEILTAEELEMLNRHASSVLSDRRDQKRFEEATKIPASEWAGAVFHGDEFYHTVGDFYDMFDYYDHEDLESYPKYLWAAQTPKRVIPRLNVGDVVEHYLTDRGWEDMDTDDLNGVAELQAALDAFVEANKTIVSYDIDNTKAILLTKPDV